MAHNATVTAFYGEVGTAQYRAAIVKQAGPDLYFWNWLEADGTLIYFDLCDGRRRVFREVTEAHRAFHASGELHSRIRMKSNGKAKLWETQGWRDFEITIPLDSIPTEAPQQAPWKEVRRKIILRPGDFKNAAGVNLIFCLATPYRIEGLKKQWQSYWTLDGARTIIVGAEPIPWPTRR